jgi:hypothetical protein
MCGRVDGFMDVLSGQMGVCRFCRWPMDTQTVRVAAHPQTAAARPGRVVGHTQQDAEVAAQGGPISGQQRQDGQGHDA